MPSSTPPTLATRVTCRARSSLLNNSAVDPAWVLVTDLGASQFPAAMEELNRLADDTSLGWIDHHQWDEDALAALRSRGHAIVDESRCATSIVVALRAGTHEASFPLESDGAPDRHRELAEVVNDFDLWMRDDQRSDRVGAFADHAPEEVYMEAALDGIEMLERYATDIDRYERENDALHERAVESASRTHVGGLDVAFTYGDCQAPAVGAELVEDRGADLAVLLGPTGVVRFFAHSSGEEFAACHRVAHELGLGGGGHTTAAGADLGHETFSEYLTLWAGEEQAYRDEIERAILDAS